MARERHCAQICAAAVARASVTDPGTALATIDEADARCDCMRFTEGDEPPEHSAARAALAALPARDADAVLARARGPILRSYRKP